MKEITYYIANDGTRFDDEDDCKSYEIECEAISNADFLVLLDEDFHPLKIDEYTNAVYIIIRDTKAIEPLKAFCANYGYYTPWDFWLEEQCGVYFYDYEKDRFYNLEDKIKYFTDIKANIDFTLGNEFGFDSLYK